MPSVKQPWPVRLAADWQPCRFCRGLVQAARRTGVGHGDLGLQPARIQRHGALQLLRAHSTYIPFIVVSRRVGEEEAVALMKSGADDYVRRTKLAMAGAGGGAQPGETETGWSPISAARSARERARFKAIVRTAGHGIPAEFEDDGSPSFIM